ALATVISTWGSAPRPAGSVMAISQTGGLAASVSGGCVGGAALSAAQGVMAGSVPQHFHFGVQDEDSGEVGLACGGQIHIFVQPAEPTLFAELLPRLKADQPMTLSTVLKGPAAGSQTLVDADGQPLVQLGDAPALRGGLQPARLSHGEQDVFVSPIAA